MGSKLVMYSKFGILCPVLLKIGSKFQENLLFKTTKRLWICFAKSGQLCTVHVSIWRFADLHKKLSISDSIKNQYHQETAC